MRRAQLIDALHHRLGEVDKRRTPGSDASRDALVGELLTAARAAIDRFAKAFDQMGTLRERATKVLGKVTKSDNIKFDGLSRVAHVTDATDWRVEYPSWCSPDTEAGNGRVVKAASSWV